MPDVCRKRTIFNASKKEQTSITSALRSRSAQVFNERYRENDFVPNLYKPLHTSTHIIE